ncbi:MAG: nucleoside 2-deoxyribosyltransferase [Alphaproteobacteria bacterium]|nr:nucleoside 2-deoxyribosyltransferase [Alphaproteobacteria bacterium]
MKIYFGGSIRGGRQDKALYLQIIDLLKEYGPVLTEHVGEKTLSELGEHMVAESFIYQRDMDWIKECDVLVAEVTQPSLGVGYEIREAEMLGKRILCLYRAQDGRSLSAMVRGSPHLTVKHYSDIADITLILAEFFK